MIQSLLQRKNAKATEEEEEEQEDRDDASGKKEDEQFETEKEIETRENGGKLLFFAIFAPKCMVICEQDTKFYAKHITFSVAAHTLTFVYERQPQLSGSP